MKNYRIIITLWMSLTLLGCQNIGFGNLLNNSPDETLTLDLLLAGLTGESGQYFMLSMV